jgi:peptide/nickel transport system permease protein
MIDRVAPASAIPVGFARSRRTLWGDAARRFVRNRLAMVGLAIVGFLTIIGVLAPLLAPFSPLTMGLRSTYMPPSSEHLFGTDELGRDILSRMMYAARYDLAFTLLTVAVAAVAGVLVGTVAAYWGGIIDTLLMRTVDVLLAFPVFMLGLALVAFMGPSTVNVVTALAVTRFPRYARLIRGLVLSTQEREYVEAARAIGASSPGIITRHILPNSIAPVVIYATLDMGTTITALAGLSFLGVGIQPPTPDWGLMLTTARNNLAIAPWTAVFPGLAISVCALGFNFMGDGLRDALDPRS